MVRTSKRRRIIEEASEAVEGITLYCLLKRALNNSDDESAERSASPRLPYVLGEEADSDSELDAAHTASQFLEELKKHRVLDAQMPVPKRKPIIEELEYWAERGNRHRFRGIVRMPPAAFYELVDLVAATSTFNNQTRGNVEKQLAVALYRLGRSGNGARKRDCALQCGCSEGSVIAYTQRSVRALCELKNSVVTWASEEERQEAGKWVEDRSGVSEWQKGWAVLEGTQINMAWRPATNSRRYFNHNRNYSINASLVMLPHTMRIINCVIGYPGSAQDSRVFKSGSQVASKLRLHFDEGEFMWCDGGYGQSAFTVSPYTAARADLSRDLQTFNRHVSSVRVRAEHGIAYLKQRFQCLQGYRGNLYRDCDFTMANSVIMACIVAHTVAGRHDHPDDVGAYLGEAGVPNGEVADLIRDMQRQHPQSERHAMTCLTSRQAAQDRYEEEQAQELAERGPDRMDRQRKERAQQLREDMHQALFDKLEIPFVDTDTLSRREERTSAARAEFQRNAREHRRQHADKRRSRQSNGSTSQFSNTQEPRDSSTPLSRSSSRAPSPVPGPVPGHFSVASSD